MHGRDACPYIRAVQGVKGRGAEMAWDQMEAPIKRVIEIKNRFMDEKVTELWGQRL